MGTNTLARFQRARMDQASEYRERTGILMDKTNEIAADASIVLDTLDAARQSVASAQDMIANLYGCLGNDDGCEVPKEIRQLFNLMESAWNGVNASYGRWEAIAERDWTEDAAPPAPDANEVTP